MAILDFSVSGWHGFGSVTQVCFGMSVSNFMCMSIVAVGRSLTIVSYVAFKIAALWFWTMFNCNPPIAHCHPLLWGGGILVDHWSTISSLDVLRDRNWNITSFTSGSNWLHYMSNCCCGIGIVWYSVTGVSGVLVSVVNYNSNMFASTYKEYMYCTTPLPESVLTNH